MKKSEILEKKEEEIINKLEGINFSCVASIELAQSYIKTLSMINPVIVSLKIREKKETKLSGTKGSIHLVDDIPSNPPF